MNSLTQEQKVKNRKAGYYWLKWSAGGGYFIGEWVENYGYFALNGSAKEYDSDKFIINETPIKEP